jgi:predicted transcriptional regulator
LVLFTGEIRCSSGAFKLEQRRFALGTGCEATEATVGKNNKKKQK